MVLIWTDLACGDREMATVLVALNAVFQVLLYALLGYFYLQVLPGWLGLQTTSLHVSVAEIAGTVAVFLGIPLAAGYLTRTLGERARGRDWYEHRFLPRIAPLALYGLLFTVVILFALQGKKITSEPLDVARIALPLLAYFAIMWFAGFTVSRRLHLSYPHRLPGVLRGQQRLRAGDRGRHRRVRGDQRAGPGRRRRTAHRSARHARAGLRRARGPPPLLPRQGGHAMNCFDCGAHGGDAVCASHAHVTARWLTRTMVINRVVAVEPPARTIRCSVCQAARDAAPVTSYTAAG
jgi:Sodium Bile acid symporter family